MAGDVQIGELVINNIRALAVKLIDDAADGLFVAGNGGGGDDDAVARLDLHLTVAGERHAVQRGHVFALRAGGNDDDLILRQRLDGVDVNQRAVGDLQIAQLHRDLQDVFHAAARDGDLAAVLVRGGDDALQAECV